MANNSNKQNLKGFSLLEIIITISIMMAFAFIVFPVGINNNQKSKLQNYASLIVTDIYYQQQRSKLTGLSNGILLGTNSYTLFDGESYSTATETDLKKFPQNIRITGISLLSPGTNEILFTNGSFKPTYEGSFQLTDSINVVRVYINKEGLTWYE